MMSKKKNGAQNQSNSSPPSFNTTTTLFGPISNFTNYYQHHVDYSRINTLPVLESSTTDELFSLNGNDDCPPYMRHLNSHLMDCMNGQIVQQFLSDQNHFLCKPLGFAGNDPHSILFSYRKSSSPKNKSAR